MKDSKLDQLDSERLERLLYDEIRYLETQKTKLGLSHLKKAKDLLQVLSSKKPELWHRFKDYLQEGEEAKPSLYSLAMFLERRLGVSLVDDEFIVSKGDKENSKFAPLEAIVLLDDIRSAFNVGSIFRATECAGFKKIVLGGYTSTPDNKKLKKAAMSCDEFIEWEAAESLLEWIQNIKKLSYRIYALETSEKAESYHSFLPKKEEKFCLLLGNEAFGIHPDLLSLCDQVIRIPCFGRKNSLNVAQAFSVVALNWSERLRAL